MLYGGPKKTWVVAVEIALALLVIGFVGAYFARVYEQVRGVPLVVRWELLVLAGLLYLLAHLCWAAFWVRLLHREGVHVPWGIALRAYYISQFGKYIPGKVAVLFMRVGMLRHHGGHPIPVAVTATFETLTSMSAGALLAVLFLPALGVLPAEVSQNTTALFAVIAVPVGLALLSRLAARIARSRRGPHARPLPVPSVLLLAQGLVHGACGYGLLALSLGVTVGALVTDAPAWTPGGYFAEVAAVGLAYVGGFVVIFVPGGLGAREFVLAACLTPRLEPALGEQAAVGMAAVIAVVLRCTWTVSEVILGLLLYARKPALPPAHPAAAHESPTHA